MAFWGDHALINALLQILEHAPFFLSAYNARYLLGAVLYTYIHAAVVVSGCLTLHKVLSPQKRLCLVLTSGYQSTWHSRVPLNREHKD